MRMNYLILFLFALTVCSSCKKSVTDATSEILMTVKEYKTNIPLAGVKISLYKCSYYDFVFGCQSKSLFATHITDQNGMYKFSLGDMNRANEGIILSKFQYWDTNGGEGERLMEPEAIVNLAITTSRAYPDTSLISLETSSEFGTRSYLAFKAPKDSTVNFRIFGNETNQIIWRVFTKDLSCYQFCPVDVLNNGSLTLNPKRFETLMSSIDY